MKKLGELSLSDPQRKILLNAIRRQGNYSLKTDTSLVRPVRRPRCQNNYAEYVACNYCLGLFKKQYLRRHRKKCDLRDRKTSNRENHLSETQIFTICSGLNKEFYDKLRLKNEVFKYMRNDEISEAAMNDILICTYGESQLKKHKRVQIRSCISNRMREMGRLLIALRKMTGIQSMSDILKPEYFDNIVTATKIISGYNEESRTFNASSLALHMGTRLKQMCDSATNLIIKKSRFIKCVKPEEALQDVKRLRQLIQSHWNTELSSIALKDQNEKQWEKPKLLPLTSDIQIFQRHAMKTANEACENLEKEIHTLTEYRKLTECVLALTLLLNRKRIGEVQYLKLKTYLIEDRVAQQTEFIETLSENEKFLTKSFKRVVTGGKGTRPVAILFPPKFQSFIKSMIKFRNLCVPESNEYLFANPRTENRWLSGYHVLKKLALSSGVNNVELFTSTRLRKQIATILQVMNFSDQEIEQFATFMGHTRKTHETFYR